MHEKKADPFYCTSAWKRARTEALRRDCGLCVWCRDAGRTARDKHGRRVPVLATMVHHMEHLSDNPSRALDLTNLVSLCDRCHDAAHPEKHMTAETVKTTSLCDVLGIRVETL